ncbi:acyl carrier protein [Rhodococcus sp. H29-C3]|uniref:acyl carrier protein n=1 Tax=Rhodococcus sp. H29-C3 TaxID=3046307 RepID=UPI0024BA066D|nr:acyl carrier protein [Rhodococcus sp. H29-C3]MDJ0362465.1 acyl carrier protein [Rhodococcus sp. H29-C3]
MEPQDFSIADLRRILTECAGVDETVNLDDDILAVEFDQLGYDSLAILETASRVEREYGVSLDETALQAASTPEGFIALVRSLEPASLNERTAI